MFITMTLFILAGCQTVETSSPTSNTTTSEMVSSESETSTMLTEEETTSLPTSETPTTTITPTTIEETTVLPTTRIPTTEIISTDSIDTLVEINLFSINDFHGGAYSDIQMISNISAYLNAFEGHQIALSNGDIFQGTAISNYYHGQVLVDALNLGGFDGFVIGNHEFDWGIDVIGQYRDGEESNGELNHPVLAANIVHEDTQEPLDFTQPYIIEEVEGVRVGIIGLIGLLENSIAASRLDNILFLDPVDTAATYARILREDFDVDIVAVYIHDTSERNHEYAALSGLERIDAMFNAHNHRYETTYIRRDGMDMPYAQMNNDDVSLVHIQLIYDTSASEIFGFSIDGIENYQMHMTDPLVDDIIYEYANDQTYLSFINEVLTESQGYYDRDDLAKWGASVIRDYAGVDIGATNAGGFRVSMNPGELTMGELITIYPFDNVIKTSRMTGQQILDFYLEIESYGSDVVFDDGVIYNQDTETLEINGRPIDLQQYYTVGAVDYIFDKNYYDFIEGTDIRQTIYYMRDLLAMDLRHATNGFNPYHGTYINE